MNSTLERIAIELARHNAGHYDTIQQNLTLVVLLMQFRENKKDLNEFLDVTPQLRNKEQLLREIDQLNKDIQSGRRTLANLMQTVDEEKPVECVCKFNATPSMHDFVEQLQYKVTYLQTNNSTKTVTVKGKKSVIQEAVSNIGPARVEWKA